MTCLLREIAPYHASARSAPVSYNDKKAILFPKINAAGQHIFLWGSRGGALLPHTPCDAERHRL